MANDLAVQGKVRLEVDRKEIEQADKAMVKVKGHISDAEKMSRQFDKSLQMLGESFATLEQSAQDFGDAANSFLEPLNNFQDTYLQKVGATEQASIAWLKSTERITQAQMKLGRVATQALQPMQDKLAKIVDVAASFIEKHPEILQFAAGIGGALLAAQTVLTIATQAKSTIASIGGGLKSLTGMSGMQLAGGALAVGGGAAVGLGVTNLIGRATGNKELANMTPDQAMKKVTDFFLQTITVAGYAIVKLVRILQDAFENFIFDVRDKLASMIPGGGGLGVSAGERSAQKANLANLSAGDDARLVELTKIFGLIPEAVEPLKQVFGEQDLQRYAQFLKQREQEQTQFNLQLLQMDEQYQKQKLSQEQEFERQALQQAQDYARQRAQEQASFDRELAQGDADHRRETALAQADFNRQSKRVEEDFQLQQIRAQEDHYRNIQDAAARLDALAVLNEQRDFTASSARAKQDHTLEVKRAKEEFKVQQKAQEDNYRWQRQRQIENFRYQQKLADDNFRREQERARLEFQNQQRIQEQEYQFQRNQQIAQYNLQRQMQAQQYQFELQQQQNFYNMSASALASYYNNLRNQINTFINGGTISGGGSSGGGGGGGGGSVSYAEGGYMRPGLNRTHSGEFALTSNTTKMLEGMAGGRLTQSRVAALGRGGGGGMVNTLHFYDVGSKSPGELQREVESAFANILRDYNDGRLS